jgi:thioredoxin-related protein
MKNKLVCILIFLFNVTVEAQENQVIEQINWLTFEETGEKFLQYQKPIMVFLYSNDCDSCEKMLDETFQNQEVVKYLNILFYNIKLDVETSDSITFFDGKVFGKQTEKKYNDIIYSLIGDSIQLPAILMFNAKAEGVVFYGFKDRDHIFPVLIYYNEKIYNSTQYDIFEKKYFEAYPVGQQQIMTRLNIKWMTFNEMLEAQKTEPKKILIDIYYNYSIAATMMRTKTYNDPIIANYLNENYYCTTVEAQGDEEFTIKDVTYKNSGESHEFHQFAIAVLQGKMQFPAFIILDEEFNLLDRIQYYLTSENFEPIMKFYGEDKYKTIIFSEYIKTFDSSFED